MITGAGLEIEAGLGWLIAAQGWGQRSGHITQGRERPHLWLRLSGGRHRLVVLTTGAIDQPGTITA